MFFFVLSQWAQNHPAMVRDPPILRNPHLMIFDVITAKIQKAEQSKTDDTQHHLDIFGP